VAHEIMYKLKDVREREFVLSFTHEEIVMDLLRKHILSYQDLPIAVYHFSTKFRNELRARSGILRGREFLMKDLYSAHTDEQDLQHYYEMVKEAYGKIFTRLGFTIKIIEAAGGVFTQQRTHEFQVITPGGEDTIYYCDRCTWGKNREIYSGKAGDRCPQCKTGSVISAKAIEVGNIFPLGTRYAEKMGVNFTDSKGKKHPVWFGSYGIGPTRVLGALVEVSHDDRGIIWYPQVAPFEVHLVELKTKDVRLKTEEIYRRLQDEGIDVLLDDRDVSAGEKFADADLIGIPVRLVVSQKTGDRVEWKRRDSEKAELLSYADVIDRLKKLT